MGQVGGIDASRPQRYHVRPRSVGNGTACVSRPANNIDAIPGSRATGISGMNGSTDTGAIPLSHGSRAGNNSSRPTGTDVERGSVIAFDHHRGGKQLVQGSHRTRNGPIIIRDDYAIIRELSRLYAIQSQTGCTSTGNDAPINQIAPRLLPLVAEGR